jgi:hypothetical protein
VNYDSRVAEDEFVDLTSEFCGKSDEWIRVLITLGATNGQAFVACLQQLGLRELARRVCAESEGIRAVPGVWEHSVYASACVVDYEELEWCNGSELWWMEKKCDGE